MKLPEHVGIRESILHPTYWLPRLSDGPGYETHVCGVGTEIIASRFRAGESVTALANDYGLTWQGVEAALRWEMYSRRVRVRSVQTIIASERRR